jgi:alpha-glucosidase
MPSINSAPLSSPDGRIDATFFLDERKALNYAVSFKNQKLIERSHLEIVLSNAIIGKECKILSKSANDVKKVYDMPVGKSSKIVDNCREGRIALKSKTKIRYDIIFRVYNDGVAFRFYFPEKQELKDIDANTDTNTDADTDAGIKIKIKEEHSHFAFLKDCNAYAMEINTNVTPTKYIARSYENHYIKTTLSAMDGLIGMPLLIEGDNFYAAITEANLKNYGGSALRKEGDYTLVTEIARAKEDDSVSVRSSLPLATPWRVIMVGEQLSSLVESDIMLNLNDDCKINDTSWIVPGKAVWPWWRDQIMDTQVFKRYTDFASEHNVKYLIIDAGWYCREDAAWRDPLNQDATVVIEGLNLKEIIEYAKERGVKIMLWVHGATLQKQLDESLKTYSDWGIAGIKVDDWGREDQQWVNFLLAVAEKAADYKLVVDFHGTYKPTGVRREYPNVLTVEAVLGLEYSKWSKRCTLKHEVTIPFTRMLVGPMDFTPGAVTPYRDNVEGTAAHQLAMYVVYESPLQMLVDYPEAYENNRNVISFLERVPTKWDETRLLGGKVGEYIVIARRSGKDWFIGAMTDENARELSIKLDFLEEEEYICDIYTDSDAEEVIEHRNAAVKKDSVMVVCLAGGGGFAAHLIANHRREQALL